MWGGYLILQKIRDGGPTIWQTGAACQRSTARPGRLVIIFPQHKLLFSVYQRDHDQSPVYRPRL